MRVPRGGRQAHVLWCHVPISSCQGPCAGDIYTHIHNVCVCVCVCVCECMCVCVCVKYNTYVHIYIYTHIYIHTHTHACRSDRLRSSTAREGESVSNCPEPPTRTPSLLRPFAHFPRSISPALTVPLPARQAGTQSMKGWLKGSLEGALEPPLEPRTHAPAARAHDAARAPRRVQHVRPPLLQGLQKQVCVCVCVCARARVRVRVCVCVCVCARAHAHPLRRVSASSLYRLPPAPFPSSAVSFA